MRSNFAVGKPTATPLTMRGMRHSPDERKVSVVILVLLKSLALLLSHGRHGRNGGLSLDRR